MLIKMRALNFFSLAAIIILLGYMVWGAAFFWQQRKRIHLSLCQTDCRDIILTETDINPIVLNGISIVELDLSEADLRNANLGDLDLKGVDLSGAYLKGGDLSETDLSKANLSGANLSGADLSEAYLRLRTKGITRITRRARISPGVTKHVSA